MIAVPVLASFFNFKNCRGVMSQHPRDCWQSIVALFRSKMVLKKAQQGPAKCLGDADSLPLYNFSFLSKVKIGLR